MRIGGCHSDYVLMLVLEGVVFNGDDKRIAASAWLCSFPVLQWVLSQRGDLMYPLGNGS